MMLMLPLPLLRFKGLLWLLVGSLLLVGGIEPAYAEATAADQAVPHPADYQIQPNPVSPNPENLSLETEETPTDSTFFAPVTLDQNRAELLRTGSHHSASAAEESNNISDNIGLSQYFYDHPIFNLRCAATHSACVEPFTTEAHLLEQTEDRLSAAIAPTPQPLRSLMADSLQIQRFPPDAAIPPFLPDAPDEPLSDEPIQAPQEPEQADMPDVDTRQQLLDALTSTATRYSSIANPTDMFTFNPSLFRPNQDENYIDTDIRFASDTPVINRVTYGHFPEEEQFYWVLPNNRVVMETAGWQAGLVHRGRSVEQHFTQQTRLEQAFLGYQAVWFIPNALEDIVGDEVGGSTSRELQVTSAVAIAGQITNPEGIPAGEVIFDLGIDRSVPNIIHLDHDVPALGVGSTRNRDGGGALFDLLEARNAPLVLQGFPTTELGPLLNGGRVDLTVGEVIPDRALARAGIAWGDPTTGAPSQFSAAVTSMPGIKAAQRREFDNYDLLNILVNPFLAERERNVAYFNSLSWVPLGQRQPDIQLQLNHMDERDWYQAYISRARNRTLIEYDPLEPVATYSSVFSNPGLSIMLSDRQDVDWMQSANASLGLGLGAIAESINLNHIDEYLAEARQQFAAGEGFAALETQATSEQRRQINQRLNRTLAFADVVSSLEQVSAKVTVPSRIRPNRAHLFQVRAGLHQRTAQFAQVEADRIRQGDTFFSLLRLSNNDFGPLSFLGTSTPTHQTSIQHPINESSAVAVILRDSAGRTLVQEAQITGQDQLMPRQPNNGQSQLNNSNEADHTVLPTATRTFDLAFDRFELTRIDEQNVTLSTYQGSLLLPALEAVYSGSWGALDYGFSLGAWGNVNPHVAPGVTDNNLGVAEPSIGVNANAYVGYTHQHVNVDESRQISSIETFAPALRASWNSASGANNPAFATMSFTYGTVTRDLNISVTPTLAFIEDSSSGTPLFLVNANVGTTGGLRLNYSLELGNDIFFEGEVTQRLSDRFTLGSFVRNYTSTNVGIESRVPTLTGGLLVRRTIPQTNEFMEVQLGVNDQGTEIKIDGGFRF